MTLLIALVPALFFGFTALLPLSLSLHEGFLLAVLSKSLDWPPVTPFYVGFLTLSSLLALLFHYRHDLIAMTASFIRIIVTRKRPMTMDERIPLFLVLSLVPGGLGALYLRSTLPPPANPMITGLAWFVGFGLALWGADLYGKKAKQIYDWSLRNAAFMTLSPLALALPSGDLVTGGLLVAALLGFRREPAAKYVGWLLGPVLFAESFSHLYGLDFGPEMRRLGTLPFFVGCITCFGVSLFTLRAFLHGLENRGYLGLAFYRIGLATLAGALVWWKEIVI